MARTRAEDFETKRQGLLATAAAVMAEEGVERASMARIAARAQVSKALLYHYYPGKDALVFDIITTHLAALELALEQADSPDWPPRARLGALVQAMLTAYRDADDHHKVQLAAMPGLAPAQRAAVEAMERRITRRFAGALAALNPALHPPFLMPATMSLMGMMNWLYLWFREDGPISRADYGDLITRIMIEGIGQSPRQRTP